MRYYTYKVTFKDLPGYFYYGRRKDNGKPYFGSPKTWKRLWQHFEPEVQILQWYGTEEEADKSEKSIISATWKDKYSLNENCGGKVSEEVCRNNGLKTQNLNPHRSRNGRNTKNAQILNSSPESKEWGSKGWERSASRTSIPVECVTTGAVYSSMRQASKHTGINSGRISECCSGERKEVEGTQWKHLKG